MARITNCHNNNISESFSKQFDGMSWIWLSKSNGQNFHKTVFLWENGIAVKEQL